MKTPTTPNRKSAWSRITSVLIIVSIFLSGYSLYRVLMASPGETVTIAPGLTITKEARGISQMKRDTNGDVIVTYSDGSTENIGHVNPLKGADGRDGISPIVEPESIAQAVSDYCDSGRCKGRSVTSDDVAFAVTRYCRTNICRGADGTDGKDAVITTDMLAAAVSTYCSGGLCKGDTGATGSVGATGATGATGADGRSPVISCVIRTVNNVDTRYVAWKYSDQADTDYIDLYRLPPWAACTSPVDLRTA